MNKQPFYFEVKDVMTQFVAAFNNIIISRHDRDKNVRSKIQVRYVYAPKQRVIHDLTNRARHLTLPVVAVNITGISRDEGRVFNKLEGSYHDGEINDEGRLDTYHIPQPVPIDIKVSMSIMARYQTDVEQIISNFVPYNDPYIVISWKLPEGMAGYDQEIRSEVMWDGSMNMSYPEQLSGTEPYRLSADTSFTIKTWLFKEKPPLVKNVYRISTNTTVEAPDQPFSYTLPFYDNNTERSYIESIGPPLTAAPFLTHVYDDQASQAWGYNFNNVTNVYVSGAHVNNLSGSRVEVFKNEPNMQTLYPPFTGVEIPFDVINDNKLNYELPITGVDEQVDLIIRNPGGYDTALNSTLHGKGIFLQ